MNEGSSHSTSTDTSLLLFGSVKQLINYQRC